LACSAAFTTSFSLRNLQSDSIGLLSLITYVNHRLRVRKEKSATTPHWCQEMLKILWTIHR